MAKLLFLLGHFDSCAVDCVETYRVKLHAPEQDVCRNAGTTESVIEASAGLKAAQYRNGGQQLEDEQPTGGEDARERSDVAEYSSGIRDMLEHEVAVDKVELLIIELFERLVRDQEPTVLDIGVQLLGNLHHSRRHIDANAQAEMARERSRQASRPTTEIQRPLAPRRIPERLRVGKEPRDLVLS